MSLATERPMRDGYLQEALDAISEVWGYPFDERIDEVYLSEMIAEYPDINIVELIDSWFAYVLDNPFTERSTPRAQFRAFVRLSIGWGKVWPRI